MENLHENYNPDRQTETQKNRCKEWNLKNQAKNRKKKKIEHVVGYEDEYGVHWIS